MWTVNSEIIDSAEGLFTHRLIVSVDEVKPFVYIDDVFQHVASVPDMYLLPEDTGTIQRRNSIDLVFRCEAFAEEILDKAQDDLDKLYLRYNQVQEVTDEVLFTNGPMENSSSSSSFDFSSSSSTVAGDTSSSTISSTSSRSSITVSQSSESSELSSASTGQSESSPSSKSDSSGSESSVNSSASTESSSSSDSSSSDSSSNSLSSPSSNSYSSESTMTESSNSEST